MAYMQLGTVMNNNMPIKKLALSMLVCASALTPVHAVVTDKDIQNDHVTTDDVVTYGMGLKAQRYSPLTAINRDTVEEVRPVWAFSLGGEKQRGQESQPLVKDGVMYVTGSYSRVWAIDARTGEELWQYEARLPDGIMPCCDVINRGVALYDNLVIFGTLDAKLVALDKDTGKTVWKKKVEDYRAGYAITAAPIVVDGKVITGISGGEFGIVGKVYAYDAKSGKQLWVRPTVEGHMGYLWKDGKKTENGISGGAPGKTWPADLWKTGGGLVWTGNPEGYLMAFDDKTGEMVYKFQTGSGIVGSPVTWEMDGEQYISVLSGWGGAVPLWGGEVAKRVKHFNQGGTVWTFKLPKRYQQVAKN
jgi:alcohol dehydrogenase (cytochrome c)